VCPRGTRSAWALQRKRRLKELTEALSAHTVRMMRSGERERPAGAGAAKQKPALARPACASGCGQQVRSATARYLPGHAMRRPPSALAAAELAATLAQHSLTACALCNWSFEGSVKDGHHAFLAHRTTHTRVA
jgi:hypothetical protein